MNNEALKVTPFSGAAKSPCRLFGENVGPYPKHYFTWLYPDIQTNDWALQISFAGPDENVAGVWRTRENSDTFSLEYVQEGVFSFTQNGQHYTCRAGDLFVVQLGATMNMRCDSDYAVKKTIALVGSALPHLLTTMGMATVDVIPQIASSHIDDLFAKAFELVQNRPENHLQEASVLAYRLLLELSQHGQQRRLPEQLKNITHYLETNYAENITVEQLSSQFNIGSATLFRLFRKYMQTSPIELLIHFRMQRAKSLLLEQRYSVKDIAHQVGYRNPSFFTAEFKRLFGQTPSAFKKQNTPY
ncbi:MAG: helix-turn-helix domain-containing protein [Lentisphaeria bacterium]|jgi:AraC-like DNA-binding protein